jgi:hypothetical protein
MPLASAILPRDDRGEGGRAGLGGGGGAHVSRGQLVVLAWGRPAGTARPSAG